MHVPAGSAPSVLGSSRQVVTFGGLAIAYDEGVLRPRPWTVSQSLLAAHLLTTLPVGPVLELCAGAGQIGLLAITHQPRPLILVDSDAKSCHYARANADAADLGPLVEVRHDQMASAMLEHERFALVLADPPWVRHGEVGRHPEDPPWAIDGGPDGLDLVWPCLEVSSRHLLPGGVALLQLGDRVQARAVEERLVSDFPRLSVMGVREPGGRGLVLELEARS